MPTRPHRLSLITAVAALALLGGLSAPSAAANDRIGWRFVGTYLWVEDESFQRVVTLHRDGTFSSISQAGPTFGFTGGLGSATQTGKREITATQIDFNFDADGNATGVTRAVFVMTFDEKRGGRFQTVQGSLAGETFAPGEDPLDPASTPADTFEFDYVGERVPAD